MSIVRLATSNASVPKRACSTCAHRRGYLCVATGFPCSAERGYSNIGACREQGLLWEPKKKWPGLFKALKIFFFGEA